MSAEDDTFEIDIYGDDHAEIDNAQADGHDPAGYGDYDATASEPGYEQATGAETQPEDEIDFDIPDEPSGEPEETAQAISITQQDSALPQQGTKRKAEDGGDDGHDQTRSGEAADEGPADERPVDAGATSALKLAELHWWTTEEDVRELCAHADAESELLELAFGEHKINGKSKGEAYLEFSSLQAATAAKREIARASQVKEESGLKKTPFTVYFTTGGNPFRTAQGSTGKKEFQQSTGRGGAYNNFNNNRGGFVGRGNFVNNNNNNHMNNGRGGFNGGNMMQNRATPPQQAGWAMNGMGGYGANPMMAAGFNNMAGMGGFGAVNRGGMMNGMGMMGRGGFPNMGMGMGMNMNMMGGQRGGMMGGGGRGGPTWGAGFQQAGFNGGGAGAGFGMQAQQQGGGQQGGVNKKMKMGE